MQKKPNVKNLINFPFQVGRQIRHLFSIDTTAGERCVKLTKLYIHFSTDFVKSLFETIVFKMNVI